MSSNIKNLALEISKLDLTQVSELIKELSEVCNMDLMALLQDSSGSSSVEVEEKEAPKEKLFSIKLISFPDTKKAAILKIVKSLMNADVSLSEVKAQIEALPLVLRKGIKEAEKLEIVKKFQDPSVTDKESLIAQIEISEN